MTSRRNKRYQTSPLRRLEALEARRLLDGHGVVEHPPNADLDDDGFVRFADFLILAGNFGKVAEPAAAIQGDIDGNGRVGFEDFLVMAQDFGKEVDEPDELADDDDDGSADIASDTNGEVADDQDDDQPQIDDEDDRPKGLRKSYLRTVRFLQQHADFARSINHEKIAGGLRLTDVPSNTQVAYYPVLQAGSPTEIPADSPENRIDLNVSSSPFSGVGSLEVTDPEFGTFLCSATVISATQVLTASHCFDPDADGVVASGVSATFNLNDEGDLSSTHVMSQVTVHPGYEGFDNNPHDDLAVVELATPVPAGTKMYRISPDRMDNGEHLNLVGYGLSGDGESGFTVLPTPTDKRTGRNLAELFVIDDDASLIEFPPGSGQFFPDPNAGDELFIFDFDGPTSSGVIGGSTLGNDVETSIGGGDSGGPAFVDVNGELVIAGVNSFQWELIGITAEPGFFESLAGGTMTGAYIDWLAIVAPNSILNNAAPSFTPGADAVALEDAGPQEISWAKNVSAGEVDQSVMFELTNNSNPDLFDALPEIDSDGVLRFASKPNVSGVAQVTVVLKDDGGTEYGGQDTSPEHTLLINVLPVNDPPSFTIVGDLVVKNVPEQQTVPGFLTSFEPGPLEVDQAIAEFFITNDNASLFSEQPSIDSSGRLIFTPAGEVVGDATVSVNVRDDGGTENGGIDVSDVQIFLLTVEAEAAPPTDPGDLKFELSESVVVKEDAGVQKIKGFATNIGENVAKFAVKNSNESLFRVQPTINAKGQLKFAAKADAFGRALVAVVAVAEDGTTSESQEFKIGIEPVNDAPLIQPAGNILILVDAKPTWWRIADLELNRVERDDGADEQDEPDGDQDESHRDQEDDDGDEDEKPRANDHSDDDHGSNEDSADDKAEDQDDADNDENDEVSSDDGRSDAELTTIRRAANDNSTYAFKDFIRFHSGSKFEEQEALGYRLKIDRPKLFKVLPKIDASGTLKFQLAEGVNGASHVFVVGQDNGGTANGGRDTSKPVSFTIHVRTQFRIDPVIKELAKKFYGVVKSIRYFEEAPKLLAGMMVVIESIDKDFQPARRHLKRLHGLIEELVEADSLKKRQAKPLLEITERLLKYFDSQLEKDEAS